MAKVFRLHQAATLITGIIFDLRALRHVVGSVHGRIDGIILPIHSFIDLSVVLAGIPSTAGANLFTVEIVLFRFHRYLNVASFPKVFPTDCALTVFFQNHLTGMTRCRDILVFIGRLPFVLHRPGMIAGLDMAAVLALAVDVIVALLVCEITRFSGEILVAVQADLILIEGSVRDMVAVVADILVCRTFKARPSIHPLMLAADSIAAPVAQAVFKIVVLQASNGFFRTPSLQLFTAFHANFIIFRITAVLMASVVHRGQGRLAIVKVGLNIGILMGAGIYIPAQIAHSILEFVIPE